MQPISSSAAAAAAQALRLTIAYRGDQLRLVNRQTLAMRTPPSHDLQPDERQPGFWFQVEDGGGRVLYRRVMHNPIRFDTETVSDDPERPLRRVPIEERDGTFFLLVPMLRGAASVRLFSSPLDPGKDSEPAREILAVSLFGGSEPEPPTGTQPPGRRRGKSKKGKTGPEADDDSETQEA